VELQGNQSATGGAGSDALSGIEGAWGSAFDDTLRGDQNTDNWFAATTATTPSTGGRQRHGDYSEAGAPLRWTWPSRPPRTRAGRHRHARGIENLFGSASGDTLKAT